MDSRDKPLKRVAKDREEDLDRLLDTIDEWRREERESVERLKKDLAEQRELDNSEYWPGDLKKLRNELIIAYTGEELSVKEMATKRRVMGWLYPEWIAMLGPDPPDLFATDGEYVIGVGVVAQSLRRNTFDVSVKELSFKDGEIVFVMEIETEKNRYEYLVLTPSEMAARLKGKTRRGNRIYSNVPRSLKGWEEYRDQKDKLRWRPK